MLFGGREQWTPIWIDMWAFTDSHNSLLFCLNAILLEPVLSAWNSINTKCYFWKLHNISGTYIRDIESK